MAKVRVYELAQKLGLESKALVEQLQEAGIEVKSHASVIDDEDIQRFEASTSAPEPTVEKVEEERISTGIIRRRRREVPRDSSVPDEGAASAVSEAEETTEPTESPEADIPDASEQVISETTASEPEEAPAVPADIKETEKAVAESPGEEAKPVLQSGKATASRAKILGRVELPTKPTGKKRPEPQKGAEKKGSRPDAGARPHRPAPKADTVPPADAAQPGSGKEIPRGKKKKRGRGGESPEGGAPGGDFRRRKERREIYEPDRNDKLRRGRRGAKPVKKTEVTVAKAIKRIIRISDAITVGELAKRMGVKANDLIKELMRQGTMVTINHPLDYETAAILASEFSYEVENVAFDEETILKHEDIAVGDDEQGGPLEPRPPVVTIMGHVDHGKTSLLDAIRTTDVTAGEAGGITQHIGAYDVELEGKKITFLDTPGHEAFTSMRSRGAKVTDIVILVVAADDGVMPQTKEAINHARAAEVPIIVAINKIDKPDSNPDRVKQELTEFELVPEDWGGDTIFVEVSAKNKTNLDQLLEMILLQAEVMDLKANPNKRAKGIIVEARLDRGRGPVATVLVQEGTLKIGSPIVTGVHFGRVRTMADDRGKTVEIAGPSVPVEVTGISGVPEAGDTLHAVEDEKTAKEVAGHRQQKLREAEPAQSSKISLEQLYARIQEGAAKELKVVIKGDVQGSVEAVKESLVKLSTDACKLIVIHSGVGGITESDVSLASASDAIVLGFNVRPESKASTLAENDGVDIRLYNIIYDAVADIRNAMEGLLAPTLKEKELGRAEVRDTFSVSKVGTIAGCYMVEGKAVRNAQARLVRDSVVIWQGKISSLKRFKDDVKEVASGYECGIGLENFNDIKVGDFIEFFEIEEIKTVL